jgi:hypothetical protein
MTRDSVHCLFFGMKLKYLDLFSDDEASQRSNVVADRCDVHIPARRRRRFRRFGGTGNTFWVK